MSGDHSFHSQPGSRMCVCGAADVEHPAWVRSTINQLTRERDLAIAHDRQPYPTAWAYERVCELLRETKKQSADRYDADQPTVTKAADGQLTIQWPAPIPRWLQIAPELLTELVDRFNACLDREKLGTPEELTMALGLLRQVVNDEPFFGPCDDCFWCSGPHTYGRGETGRVFDHEPECLISRARTIVG